MKLLWLKLRVWQMLLAGATARPRAQRVRAVLSAVWGTHSVGRQMNREAVWVGDPDVGPAALCGVRGGRCQV